MNRTLAPLLRKCALVFFDDILVYSTSYEQHLVHLQVVLQLLADKEWKVKMSKCEFAQPSVHYLGHVISAAGMSTDESKISAVRDWPTLVDAKQL
jgi:hypothetical protein